MHLRHRQLPAAEHRPEPGALARTACSRRSRYQIDEEPAAYALEGSIAVAGSLVQWLRDNLGLIRTAAEIETLARDASTTTAAATSCRRSPGCSPRTGEPDARGVIVGLTGTSPRAHLARAVLEATAWQTREVVDAMNADAGRR